jgi:hypothetical protein
MRHAVVRDTDTLRVERSFGATKLARVSGARPQELAHKCCCRTRDLRQNALTTGFLKQPHVEVRGVIATTSSGDARKLVTGYFERVGKVEESSLPSLVATTGSFRRVMGSRVRGFPTRWDVLWTASSDGCEVIVVGRDDFRFIGRSISLRPSSQRSMRSVD